MKKGKMEKEDKNRLKQIRRLSYLEIFLIVMYSFAIAFLIGLQSPNVSAQSAGDFFSSFVNSGQSGNTNSDGSVNSGNVGCCFDTVEGLCSPNSYQSACEAEENGQWLSDESCNENQCEQGCCILGSESRLGTKRECERLEELHGIPGRFDSSIQDELTCVGLSQSQSEGACVIENSEGGKNACKFGTKSECQSIGGNFYQDYLCSNPELETSCEKQASTNCVEGKDEIYWFDSCGNRENIYDANKDKAWNNGEVLSKEESCGQLGDGIDSKTCGNCDYTKGSVCAEYRAGVDTKKSDGNFVCRDLNCVDEKDNGKTRINGESWCVYDGVVGGGNDVVGSRHFREVCVNGEIRTEPCADYRKEICVETKGNSDGSGSSSSGAFDISSIFNDIFSGFSSGGILGSNSGNVGLVESFGGLGSGISGLSLGSATNSYSDKPDQSGAFCRTNMWEDCAGRNIATCLQNPDCQPNIVWVDSDFHFESCVPKYPPGMEVKGGASGLGDIGGIAGDILGEFGGSGAGAFSSLAGGLGGSGGDICSAGTKTCVVVYQKLCPGGWTCVKNCECEKITFTAQMNNNCRMLGDCGGYVNIDGVPTDGGYSITKKGGKAKKPPRLFGLQALYAINAFGHSDGIRDTGFFDNIGGMDLLSNFGIQDMFGLNSMPGDISVQAGLGSPGQLGRTIGLAGAGAGVGAIGGAIALPGSLTAANLGTITATSGVAGLAPIAIGAAIGAVVVLGVMAAMGCGNVEESEITFECKQWTPPAFGLCDSCNDDPQKTCSKYRCESLGSNCQIINEGTGFDECISKGETDAAIVISEFEDVLTEGYNYEDVSTNGFKVRTSERDCVEAFTPIVYGVKTNVPAVCTISESIGGSENVDENSDESEIVDYSGGEFGFLEGNIFTLNHTSLTYLPSAESIIGSEVSSAEEFAQASADAEVQDYLLNVAGEINLHVKCTNINGVETTADYQINFCVNPGPDLTPPVVLATAPKEDSYVAYNATEMFTTFFINEPAECKYDSSDLGYFDMANDLECETNVGGGTLLGYPCNVNLEISDLENEFYVKCRDQPWLEESEERNIGDGYKYVLKRTEDNLAIDSITPENDELISRGSSPASVEVNVKTSGGVSNGESACQYKLNEGEWINFANTFSNEHKQIFSSLIEGEYNLGVRCADNAANTIMQENSFSLVVDDKPPIVTRVFTKGEEVAILTDEAGSCVFMNSSISPNCNFRFENGTSMDYGEATLHAMPWSKEILNVKCRDIWGNEPDQCSVTIKPYEIQS